MTNNLKKSNTEEPGDTSMSEAEALAAANSAEHNITDVFLPILPMAAPDVFSGVFLKFSPFNQNLNLDVLTVGGRMNSSMGNPHLCLSKKRPDDDADKFDPLKQWVFEKSEKDGYFILRNRKISGGCVTWEDDDEQYLVIEQRQEFQRVYRKGGPLRQNVLFKVVRAEGSKVGYHIRIKGMDDGDIGIRMDPSWLEHSGCYLLRRTSSVVSYEGEKLENLFKIHKADTGIKLIGMIEDITFKENVNDLYKKANEMETVKELTSRHVFNHGDNPLEIEIDDAYERKDRFHIKFDDSQSMLAFQEIWVPTGLSIGETLSDNSTVSSTIKLNQLGKATTEKFKYHITGAINISTWSTVKYRVLFGWLENFSLQFQATLKIFGKGDRMTFADKPRVVPDQLISFGIVYESLAERGFENDHQIKDPQKLWYRMPIKGTVYAESIGIKGDVEITIKQLSRNIPITCHVSDSINP